MRLIKTTIAALLVQLICSTPWPASAGIPATALVQVLSRSIRSQSTVTAACALDPEKVTQVAPEPGHPVVIVSDDKIRAVGRLIEKKGNPVLITCWGEEFSVEQDSQTNSPGLCDLGRIVLCENGQEWTSGYELWQEKGYVQAARDMNGEIVGLGTFNPVDLVDSRGELHQVILIQGEKGKVISWERPGEISPGFSTLPLGTCTGDFLGFIPWDQARGVFSRWNSSSSQTRSQWLGSESSPWASERTLDQSRSNPILPGKENYDSKITTSFFKAQGYEVYGKVRPWSNFMAQGTNVRINRAQKLRVTFKGPHSQNFYIFRSNSPDEYGTVEWFSGTFGYSDKVVYIPVQGGFWYGFCAGCPKAQTVTIEWDSSK